MFKIAGNVFNSLLFFCSLAYSQDIQTPKDKGISFFENHNLTNRPSIYGNVKNNLGVGLSKAKIHFIELNESIYSDKNGNFRSPPMSNGSWSLMVSKENHKSTYQEIFISNNNDISWAFVLERENGVNEKHTQSLSEISAKRTSSDDIRNRHQGNISFLDNNRIKELQLKDIEKIESVIPNFETVYWSGASSGRFATRGIAPLRDEAVVGFYVNGTPLLFDYRPSLLSEILAIKVLKGPQLGYGVSPVGGIIDITTLTVSEKYLINLSIGLANFGGMDYSLETFLPLIKNKLQLNLSGYWENLGGYFTNTRLGDIPAGGFDEGGFNASLNYREGGHSATFSVQYKSSRENHLPFAYNVNLAEAMPYIIEHNTTNLKTEDVLGFSLSYSYTFRDALLSSFLAFRTLDKDEIIDTDFSSRAFGGQNDLVLTTDNHSYFVDAEVSVKSMDAKGGFTWKGGLYFNTGESFLTNQFEYVNLFNGGIWTLPFPGDSDFITGKRKRDNLSIWGGGAYTLAALSLNVEGRIDYHQREIESSRTENRIHPNVGTNSTNFSGQKDYFFFSPKASISFNRPFLNLFGNVSYISKPGDYNFLISDPDDFEYQPERLLHYELGIKLFPSKKFFFAITGFAIEWEDIHIYTFRNARAYEYSTINGGRAESIGAELESFFRINGFLLEVNLGYTRAVFLDGASKAIIDPFNTSGTGGNVSFAGNKIPFTPNFSSLVAMQYKKQLQTKRLHITPYARVEYIYKSGYYFSELNINKSEPTHLLNAKLGLDLNGYEVIAYVNNILNQQNYVYIVEFTGFSENPLRGEPLRYGITFSKKFEI